MKGSVQKLGNQIKKPQMCKEINTQNRNGRKKCRKNLHEFEGNARKCNENQTNCEKQQALAAVFHKALFEISCSKTKKEKI